MKVTMKKFIYFLIISLAVSGCSLLNGDSGTETSTGVSENSTDRQETGFVNVPDGARVYNVDVASSSVNWNARKAVGAEHVGGVEIKEGSIYVDEQEMVGGKVVIDMNTISDDDLEGAMNQQLITHLKSDDFFAVETYPEAVLEIKQANLVSEEGETRVYNVVADLTIKGITNEIEFEASVSGDESAFVAEASFSIDRSKWDVRWGSGSFFDDLGDNLVEDEIDFDVVLTASDKS